MASGRGGKSLMEPLLIVNFVVYLILLGLAGWSLDKCIDGEQNHPHLGGNPSTTFLLTFALIGGVIGACSLFAGLIHLRAWHTGTLATASSSAFISWAVTALAFGLVCKQIILGGHRGKRLVKKSLGTWKSTNCVISNDETYVMVLIYFMLLQQTLEAFITISTLTQLLYLLLLHAGMYNTRYGPAYGKSLTQYSGLDRSHQDIRSGTSTDV